MITAIGLRSEIYERTAPMFGYITCLFSILNSIIYTFVGASNQLVLGYMQSIFLIILEDKYVLPRVFGRLKDFHSEMENTSMCFLIKTIYYGNTGFILMISSMYYSSYWWITTTGVLMTVTNILYFATYLNKKRSEHLNNNESYTDGTKFVSNQT